MRSSCLALLCLLSSSVSRAQQPTADSIMAKVAANQDQSEAERAHFVYVQHARVTSRTGKTIRCEEVTDTRIVPTAHGWTRQLLRLDGTLLAKHQLIHYTELPGAKPDGGSGTGQDGVDKATVKIEVDDGDDPMDRDLVENLRDNLTRESSAKSKDGIATGLFPLTSKTQAEYNFSLSGTETMNGRKVFHVVFVPKDKSEYLWKGDAYIDTTVYQPVVVRTRMSRQVPFAVRTLLGTSLPHLGFTVVYAPEPTDGPGAVWFPVSFGTEFQLHVLFFIRRDLTLNVENRNFEKTHVSSTIQPLALSKAAQP